MKPKSTRLEEMADQLLPLAAENASVVKTVKELAEEIGRLKAKGEELEKGRDVQAKPW